MSSNHNKEVFEKHFAQKLSEGLVQAESKGIDLEAGFARLFSSLETPKAKARLPEAVIEAIKDYTQESQKETLRVFMKQYKGNLAFVLDNEGNSILHHAAMAGRPTLVAFFLEKGMKIDAENKRGDSPLILATRTIASTKDQDQRLKLLTTLRLLTSKGAKNVVPDINHPCPKAAMAEAVHDLEALKLLVEEAHFSVNENDMMNPLDWALMSKHVPEGVVDYLKERGAVRLDKEAAYPESKKAGLS